MYADSWYFHNFGQIWHKNSSMNVSKCQWTRKNPAKCHSTSFIRVHGCHFRLEEIRIFSSLNFPATGFELMRIFFSLCWDSFAESQHHFHPKMKVTQTQKCYSCWFIFVDCILDRILKSKRKSLLKIDVENFPNLSCVRLRNIQGSI